MTTPMGKDFRIFIADADGQFIPIREIPLVPSTLASSIRCYPIPGRDGIHYVPDWFDITHFG